MRSPPRSWQSASSAATGSRSVCPNCPQFLIAEFAAWKAGAIACPFNPTYSDREMGEALRATGAETLVVLNRFYGKVKGIQQGTSLKRIIATNIKEYLPPLLRIAYTLPQGEEGGRPHRAARRRLSVRPICCAGSGARRDRRDRSRPTIRR